MQYYGYTQYIQLYLHTVKSLESAQLVYSSSLAKDMHLHTTATLRHTSGYLGTRLCSTA